MAQSYRKGTAKEITMNFSKAQDGQRDNLCFVLPSAVLIFNPSIDRWINQLIGQSINQFNLNRLLKDIIDQAHRYGRKSFVTQYQRERERERRGEEERRGGGGRGRGRAREREEEGGERQTDRDREIEVLVG